MTQPAAITLALHPPAFIRSALAQVVHADFPALLGEDAPLEETYGYEGMVLVARVCLNDQPASKIVHYRYVAGLWALDKPTEAPADLCS